MKHCIMAAKGTNTPHDVAELTLQPNATGLARYIQSPRGLELRENGKVLLHVAPLIGRPREVTGWYWYGMGRNTANTPVATMDEAKAQAAAYFKISRKQADA